MTIEELSKVPFHFVGHISFTDEHCTTYSTEDGRFGFCDHVHVKDGCTYGRSYRHWRINEKVYKTKAKFIEALKEINN